jgi:predicted MFS family arabinose efflux permease
MLVGRCVQGISGGGIITMTQVIFYDMVPLRQRSEYLAIVFGSWSIGSSVRVVVSRALVENAS